jgi:hypothetical protein
MKYLLVKFPNDLRRLLREKAKVIGDDVIVTCESSKTESEFPISSPFLRSIANHLGVRTIGFRRPVEFCPMHCNNVVYSRGLISVKPFPPKIQTNRALDETEPDNGEPCNGFVRNLFLMQSIVMEDDKKRPLQVRLMVIVEPESM